MHITIRNLATEPIIAHHYASSPRRQSHSNRDQIYAEAHVLDPSVDRCIILPQISRRKISLQPGIAGKVQSHVKSSYLNKKIVHDSEKEELFPKGGASLELPGFEVTLSKNFASWEAVQVPEGCPWRIYARKVTRKHQRVLILHRRNLSSFLADIPDRLLLSSISLPGTHDTMAFHGWPISQCQSPSTPLLQQLLSGIRVLDIRLAVIPPPIPGSKHEDSHIHELVAYHGLWPQETTFTSILSDIYTFLQSPTGSKETIIMSIKQEDFAITPASFFSTIVRNTILHGPGGWDDSHVRTQGVNKGMWFLENRIPMLGEVRGKVVMLSRFGGNGDGWEYGLEGLGIHPTTWPDSAKNGFEWELKGVSVRTHDWYAIPTFFSIPEKVELATMNLLLPSGTTQPILPITYFSAATFPLALPPMVAKGFGWPKWGLGIQGVNCKFGAWLLDQLGDTSKARITEKSSGENRGGKIRGWTFLDYYSEPEGANIVPLLVECNFLGGENDEPW